ncbi:MAG: cupin domain-containing protein [Acidobacteriota bacterium]
MKRRRATAEICEQAALYVLGVLEPAEVRAFEEHLGDCAVCETEVRGFEETASLLPLALPKRRPHPRVRDTLLARTAAEPGPQVWKGWTATAASDLHVVRGGGGGWKPVLEGVTAKQLYVDPVTRFVTMLVRMEPGAAYPPHRHGGAEQCLVLEGDLEVGDLVLHTGDYQCADSGSIHDVSRTVNGCLLLIVSSPHDQLLEHA